jgi:hypothetical protein
MSTEPSIAELKEQIRKYELQLEQEKLKNAKQREKITTMSAEVVDSNPYRLVFKYMGLWCSANTFYIFLMSVFLNKNSKFTYFSRIRLLKYLKFF